jgi:hypothetical protein
MTSNRIPQMEDVERFYARQSRQILQRLTVQVDARPSGLRTLVLAAAAVLAFAAVGIAVQPFSGLPQATLASELEPIVALPDSLPLSTYASWSTDEMLDRDDRSEMGSIDWLLNNETLLAGSDALPAFLQPFGSWPALPEPAQEVESI